MPLYATICRACDNRKDVLVRSHDTALPPCTCGGTLERAVSAPAFHLKGAGWYKAGASK